MRLEDQILHASFERYNDVFAGGDVANNKLDLEKIKEIPELSHAVISRMGHIALEYEVDLLVAVPDGANWLAVGISEQIHVPYITLKKRPRVRTLRFKDPSETAKCIKSQRIAIVEDAFNKFTNTQKVLSVPTIGERAVVAIGIWDRGLIENRPKLSVPHHALITRHIPSMLADDDPLWDYASDAGE